MSIINKARVREYALATLESKRPALKGKMTRVSGEFFDKVDSAARNFIARHIETMPSTGKTLK